MRAIVIVQIDEDKLLDAAYGCDPESLADATIEGALEKEMGWSEESGIATIEVISPDNIEANDFELGKSIRKKILS